MEVDGFGWGSGLVGDRKAGEGDDGGEVASSRRKGEERRSGGG